MTSRPARVAAHPDAPAVRTAALSKRYGSVVAVDGLDLHVPRGVCAGFLGPNGSGKTTTVRMLLGLVLPTSGEAHVLGEPVPARVGRVLPRVGALVEGPAFHGHLSGRTNLSLLDAAGPGGPRRTRRRRLSGALEAVGLAGIGRRPVRAYSLGMRQRLGLAAALLREPELLVLDEPTNGLDPAGIREVRDLLRGLVDGGTTVLLSSHLLAEVEQLCDEVTVLSAGRRVLSGRLADLTRPTGRVLVRTPDVAAAVRLLDGAVVGRDGDALVVRSGDPASLVRALVDARVRVAEVRPEPRRLEDVVLSAAGRAGDRVERPRAAP